MELLPDRLPWFLAGPLIGLLVVAMYGLVNRRMGVTGSYVQLATLVQGLPAAELWRVWFFAGLAAGALLAAVLRGGPLLTTSYGALGLALPVAVLAPVLFLGGVLMGYGARWSGGCTSGHGISGTSSLSPASLGATATFMATAVVVTFLLHVATGGAL